MGHKSAKTTQQYAMVAPKKLAAAAELLHQAWHPNTRIGSVSLSLTTGYVSEPALDMWVPSILGERYEEGVYGTGADSRVPGSGHEEIWCEATYSHFRRFEVTGGIKKEPARPQN
jgi:hypothetical protein